MSKSKISKSLKFYDNFYRQDFSVDGNLRYIDYLLERVGTEVFKKKARVLDVGCGVGVLGQVLNKRFGCEVFGIDLSKTAVRAAIKNGIKAKLADIEEPWPFENSQFDVVISQQVIEHLYDPDFFVKEAKRVLRGNGSFIITTPNLASWFNRIILLFGFQPFFTEVSTEDKTLGMGFIRGLTNIRAPLGHLRVFTLSGLKDLLKFHGFQSIKAIGGKVFYLPFFMSPFNSFFSLFPGLSSDLIVMAKKRKT